MVSLAPHPVCEYTLEQNGVILGKLTMMIDAGWFIDNLFLDTVPLGMVRSTFSCSGATELRAELRSTDTAMTNALFGAAEYETHDSAKLKIDRKVLLTRQ